MGRPFGGWAGWSARLFRLHPVRFVNARCAGSRRAGARGAGGVRRLVVLNARGAGVVRRLVVRMARRAGRDRVRGVIPPNVRRASVIACGCGSAERPLCRRDRVRVWFCRTPVVPRGSVPGWGAYS